MGDKAICISSQVDTRLTLLGLPGLARAGGKGNNWHAGNASLDLQSTCSSSASETCFTGGSFESQPKCFFRVSSESKGLNAAIQSRSLSHRSSLDNDKS